MPPFEGLPPDVNVLALNKGDEKYIFLFDDEHRADALRVLGKFATNPELSFSWYDAAVLSQRIRHAAQTALDEPSTYPSAGPVAASTPVLPQPVYKEASSWTPQNAERELQRDQQEEVRELREKHDREMRELLARQAQERAFRKENFNPNE